MLGTITNLPSLVSAQSQPTTQNPQNNVSGSLQPTGSGLQQAPNSDASQKTATTQEDLLTTSTRSLTVVGATTPSLSVQGTSGSQATTQVPTPSNKQSFNSIWVIIPVFGLGFLVLVAWQFSRPPKRLK